MSTLRTTPSNEARWTLAELTQMVELALARDYSGPRNKQIRAIPNSRTIRYYTTLGLLDRAAEMRGRTALYSLRHLLQIVAIKRLQLQGLSLTDIQARLVGLPDSRLEDIAHLPEMEFEVSATAERALEEEALESPPSRRDGAFWDAEPAMPAAPTVMDIDASPETEISILRVETGTVLLLSGTRELTEADHEALREAMRPLQETLLARGLTHSDRGETDDGEHDAVEGE